MKYWNDNVKTLTPYIPGEQPDANAKVIKLNTNENAFSPSPKVVKALKKFAFETLRLYPNANADPLRDALAEYHGVARENIICTNGSDEALSYIMNAFTSKKTNVVFTDPTYTVYETLARRFGVPFTTIPTEPDFTITLERVPTTKKTVFFLANPNAQTGLFIDRLELEMFLAVFKGLLVIDEAYVDFAPESALPLIRTHDNVLITRTFSKSFSLCGMRLGYALGDASLIEGLMRVKDSYNVNMLTQCAGLAALEDARYMQAKAKEIIGERERLRDTFTRMGWVVLPTQTNFLLVKPFGISAEALYEGLKANGIFIRYFKTERLAAFARITIGTKKENDALLTAIGTLLS